jgi:ribonuclease P protein component
VRLRRRPEFLRVYEKGFRTSSPYFAAVCLKVEGQAGPRVGFATPRKLGGSVVRNRLRRRLREAVRLNLERLAPEWMVVVQARGTAMEAPFEDLKREIEKLFSRCARS